eukprot:jgi/Mesvir1/8347/Mv12607-RA.1
MNLRRCFLARRVLLSFPSHVAAAFPTAIVRDIGGPPGNVAAVSALHEILTRLRPSRFYSPRAHPGRPRHPATANDKGREAEGAATGASPVILVNPVSAVSPVSPISPVSPVSPANASDGPTLPAIEDERKTAELEAIMASRGRRGESGQGAGSFSSSSSGPRPASSLLMQRSLNVSIVGPPNAGKSTLTNMLLGHKVTAVSRKTNTTRSEMLGVLTQGITQLVLYDTPGMLALPSGADASRHPLGKDKLRLANIAWKFTANTELFLFLVDAARQISRVDPRVLHLARCLPREHPHGVLVLNKVDAVASPTHLLPLTSDLMECFPFKSCFMISAAHNDGVDDLKNYLLQHAVPRPWEMPRGFVTYRQKERFVLEVVRERVFEWLHQEVPYGIDFEFLDWKEYAKSGDLKIELQLNVGDEHQKHIVRSKLREIGEGACLEIRKEFGRQRWRMLGLNENGSNVKFRMCAAVRIVHAQASSESDPLLRTLHIVLFMMLASSYVCRAMHRQIHDQPWAGPRHMRVQLS